MQPDRYRGGKQGSWSRSLVVCLLLIAWVGSVFSETELVLVDGQVLSGISAEREGDLYLLTQESGEVIPIPATLVQEVRLIADKPVDEPPPGIPDRPGVFSPDPEVLAGANEGAGIQHPDAQVLAGEEVRAPKTADQLAVFGEPSKFQKGVINPTWVPESGFEETNPYVNNNFAPSTWAKGVVDPDWEPEEAYEETDPTKQNNFAPSQWSKGSATPDWVPQDGFKKD